MLKDFANRQGGRMGAHLNRCVVVADDNAELLSALEYLLKAEGVEVHSADDGLTALQLCRRLHPKVIVLDLYMPHMSGLEVIAGLREDPNLRHAHVIMVSGMAGDVEELAELVPAADRHLTKPIDSDVLLAAIWDGLTAVRSEGGLRSRLERR